jgi:phosphohistidine phosphatase
MTIYFLRHASAGQSKADPARDNARGLDNDGIDQCAAIGRLLGALAVQVDTLISSPLKRATQTAALIGNELGFEREVVLSEALLPEARFTQFRQLLQAHEGSDSLMVVGHNPSLSILLGKLVVPGSGTAAIDLKKGAVAKVECRGRSCRLHWIVTPKIARVACGA